MSPGLLRLILAIIVVVHHSFPLRLGAIAVCLFFVLSGYWISRMYSSKYSKMERPYLSFIQSRWWRIAPLFVFVQFSTAALIGLGLKVGSTGALEDWRWWITQPIVAYSTFFQRLLPPSWSLDVEMQFYLLAPLVVLSISRTSKLVNALILATAGMWGAARILCGIQMDSASLDIYIGFFLLGIIADQWSIRPSANLSKFSVFGVFTVLLVVSLFPSTRMLIWQRGADAEHSTTFANVILLYLLLVVSLPFVINSVHHRSSSIDRWLGDLSYPLYLFHWIPRDIYYAHANWSLPPWQNGLYLMLNFTTAMIGAIVLLQFVDRPVQAWRSRCSLAIKSDSRSNATHGAQTQ